MNEELIRSLEDVCAEKLEDVANLDAGSEEQSRATTDLVKLLNVLKEREESAYKLDLQYQELEQKKELSDSEAERATEEAKKDRKLNWIQFGITTAVGVGTTIASHLWLKHRYHEGLDFERTGTYTCRGGAQNIMRQFKLPKL